MLKSISAVLLLSILTLHASGKNVLIEVFTNSHCGICPNAHNAINDILQSAAEPERINVIYYHMSYPYSDDPLYHHNTAHADIRDNYYGPFFFTPIAFINGVQQPGNSYGQWQGKVNEQLNGEKSFGIDINGSGDGNTIELSIDITKQAEVDQSDLVYHVVITEDVIYNGRNGISDHKDVMRYMHYPAGRALQLQLNETKRFIESINLNSEWIASDLKVVVFIQSLSGKTLYEAETKKYSELAPTSLDPESEKPIGFTLFQNYPNPFNPATAIKFSIPNLGEAGHSSSATAVLKVYDILGNEIATLVNEILNPGIHEIIWNAGGLPSGVYFYRLSFDNFNATKRMIILK